MNYLISILLLVVLFFLLYKINNNWFRFWAVNTAIVIIPLVFCFVPSFYEIWQYITRVGQLNLTIALVVLILLYYFGLNDWSNKVRLCLLVFSFLTLSTLIKLGLESSLLILVFYPSKWLNSNLTQKVSSRSTFTIFLLASFYFSLRLDYVDLAISFIFVLLSGLLIWKDEQASSYLQPINSKPKFGFYFTK